MAPISEILRMLTGQAFGSPTLPNIDLSGKTIIVTGANTGLGLECAKHLARLQTSHIILACRSIEKGKSAMATVYEDTGCKPKTTIEVWPLDLSSYASVLAFGTRVRTQLPRLDAFIANAGMELQEYRMAEGLEIHLTVNVVSTFMSAIAVLPKLRQTSQEHSVQTTITFAGSMYHIFGPENELDAGLLDDVDMFEVLSTPDAAKTDIIWRYALSKLMVHLCAHELAACVSPKIASSNVVINFVNPGWCGTELSRAKPHPMGEKVWFALLGWTAEKGSRTYVHALAQGEESHGKYLSECQIKPESAFVRSDRGRQIQEKLWTDLMRRIAGIDEEVATFVQ